jgi:hypothetical protein
VDLINLAQIAMLQETTDRVLGMGNITGHFFGMTLDELQSAIFFVKLIREN